MTAIKQFKSKYTASDVEILVPADNEKYLKDISQLIRKIDSEKKDKDFENLHKTYLYLLKLQLCLEQQVQTSIRMVEIRSESRKAMDPEKIENKIGNIAGVVGMALFIIGASTIFLCFNPVSIILLMIFSTAQLWMIWNTAMGVGYLACLSSPLVACVAALISYVLYMPFKYFGDTKLYLNLFNSDYRKAKLSHNKAKKEFAVLAKSDKVGDAHQFFKKEKMGGDTATARAVSERAGSRDDEPADVRPSAPPL